MANIWEKAISILAGNLNLGRSYLITTVQNMTFFAYWSRRDCIIESDRAYSKNFSPNKISPYSAEVVKFRGRHRKQISIIMINPLIWGILEIFVLVTPPRLSEISEKNWSTKAKPFLTSHLWYKAMLKVWRKSWEPFRIYQLTNTANPAQFHKLWLNWLS